MQIVPDRNDLRCCPTCGRNSLDVFDHPQIRLLAFEELPVPEAIDRFSGAAAVKRASTRSGESSAWGLDYGINVTPEIDAACSSEAMTRYFAALKAHEGRVVDPRRLYPPWECDRYFRGAYPIPETRFFVRVGEADDSALNHRIADVEIQCEGINFGSAGGPTLQILGAVARIHYEGLFVQRDEHAVKGQEFDGQLLAGISAYLQKARELGYQVDRMDVTASVADGICSVHFAPVSAPGTIVTGGDLSLTVDSQSQQITGIQRGQ